jgi:hypothetical protein
MGCVGMSCTDRGCVGRSGFDFNEVKKKRKMDKTEIQQYLYDNLKIRLHVEDIRFSNNLSITVSIGLENVEISSDSITLFREFNPTPT